MNKTNPLISTPPKHLSTTKFFFFLILLIISIQTFALLANMIYFSTIPASSLNVISTDFVYHLDGYIGTMNLSYDKICANLPVENPRLFALSACILIFITEFLPMILILILGQKLLKTMTQAYTPFTVTTTQLIIKIGIILILKGSLACLIIQAGMNIINFHRFELKNPIELNWLLAGVITLMLADIFEKGCALQQEVDETL